MIFEAKVWIGVSVLLYAGLWWGVKVCWKPRWLRPESCDNISSSLLTVVIAARNEAENIGHCLRSILDQPVVTRVIVVDDHSTDETRKVVESVQKLDSRLTLLAAPELPPGWVGKSHALQHGSMQVQTPYTLFTDADVVFRQGIFAAGVHKMENEGLDHMGGHFYVDCRTAAEEICAPILTLSSGLALISTAGSLGAGTGAFNMVRTAAYHAGNGHSSFKGNLVDDVALARHLKSGGAKSCLVFMDDCAKVRLFVGFKGFFNSVARSAVPFLRLGSVAVCLLTVLCMVVALLPLISAGAAIHSAVAMPDNLWNVAARLFAGALPYSMGWATVYHSRRLHNGRITFQLFYPLALFFMAASVFWAALSQMRRRPVSWRGREYAPRQYAGLDSEMNSLARNVEADKKTSCHKWF